MQMTFLAKNTEYNRIINTEILNTKLDNYIKTLPHNQIVSVSRGDMASSVVECKPYSCIVDISRTHILEGKENIKFTFEIWHDAAWGYTSRLLDIAKIIMS